MKAGERTSAQQVKKRGPSGRGNCTELSCALQVVVRAAGHPDVRQREVRRQLDLEAVFPALIELHGLLHVEPLA